MESVQAQRIVTAYGNVLAEKVATGTVRDINSLPCSKAEIKSALQFALTMTTDPTMRRHLKSAYVSLADFQELSDSQVRALQDWSALSSKASTRTSEELRAAAATISNLGKGVTSIQAKVVAEAEVLARELELAEFR